MKKVAELSHQFELAKSCVSMKKCNVYFLNNRYRLFTRQRRWFHVFPFESTFKLNEKVVFELVTNGKSLSFDGKNEIAKAIGWFDLWLRRELKIQVDDDELVLRLPIVSPSKTEFRYGPVNGTVHFGSEKLLFIADQSTAAWEKLPEELQTKLVFLFAWLTCCHGWAH